MIRRAAMVDLKARLRRQDVTPWEHWGPEIVSATERLGAYDRQTADGPGVAAHLEDARAVFRRHWAMHGSRLYVSRQPLYAAYAVVAGLSESAIKDAVDTLHAALQPPFEVLWSPGDHVHPKRPETINYITELLFSRLSPVN